MHTILSNGGRLAREAALLRDADVKLIGLELRRLFPIDPNAPAFRKAEISFGAVDDNGVAARVASIKNELEKF
jgi:hypothetical protein